MTWKEIGSKLNLTPSAVCQIYLGERRSSKHFKSVVCLVTQYGRPKSRTRGKKRRVLFPHPLTGRPVTAQRLWAIRQQMKGGCTVCGKPLVNSEFCAYHAQRRASYSLARWRKQNVKQQLKTVGKI